MSASKWRVLGVPFVLAMAAAMILHGCGKEDDSPGETGGPNEEGMTYVNGVAPFASQCPYGVFSRPVEARVNMWNCNMGMNRVELMQPLRSLVVQADCKKKLISVRSSDGKLDSLWEVMPDGSFFFTVDGGPAVLKSDGAGNLNCATPLSAQMFGKLDCKDRDRVDINLETIWWLDRVPPPPVVTPSPLPSPAPMPSPVMTPSPRPAASPVVIFRTDPRATTTAAPQQPACKIPQGCYFYAAAKIRQCE